DSTVHRLSMSDMLRSMGCSRIHEAAEGAAALEMIRGLVEPPALVIVDFDMPGMDGIELIQHLAEQRARPAVIIASGAGSTLVSAVETIVRALGFPILGSLKKPVIGTRLQEALARFESITSEFGLRALQKECVPADKLKTAIAFGEVVPFYQPKISLHTGDVVGLEALARWRDAENGYVLPNCFIPVAEKSGSIRDLTLSMLDSVLLDLRYWQKQGHFFTVALNLSANSLSDRMFADEIVRRTDAAKIARGSLVLEVTENELAGDIAASLATLVRLRLKGFGLSIDDYGTGFSSMQQLSRIPFTELKIDRSFLQGASDRTHLRIILQSAIDMGRRLGLITVAEGVETVHELKLLKVLGCAQAQGFSIAHPMVRGDLLPWLDHHRERLAKMCASTIGGIPCEVGDCS
ncbi:MAG TPA: EAL domain-containing response regulator, partial [Burkholderiales bacterium]|nr:EAL domain-containing response regulator [Burkholderiales bacterium]